MLRRSRRRALDRAHAHAQHKICTLTCTITCNTKKKERGIVSNRAVKLSYYKSKRPILHLCQEMHHPEVRQEYRWRW